MMNETFLQGPSGCTNHSAPTGTGSGCSETENLGSCHSSHHLCWASAPFRGHVTGAETVPSESALLLRAATTTHSSKENWLPSMLYCTKKPNTSHTHRMSADCYFMCHVTLIFLEMISGYLEEKKLCDSVVRNCSELKSQVFMNGKLAFGRCNTYFNVTFFSCLCIVQCHGYWSDWRINRDKQCFFFFFYNLLSACFPS